jgi:hypothetical protein
MPRKNPHPQKTKGAAPGTRRVFTEQAQGYAAGKPAPLKTKGAAPGTRRVFTEQAQGYAPENPHP